MALKQVKMTTTKANTLTYWSKLVGPVYTIENMWILFFSIFMKRIFLLTILGIYQITVVAC